MRIGVSSRRLPDAGQQEFRGELARGRLGMMARTAFNVYKVFFACNKLTVREKNQSNFGRTASSVPVLEASMYSLEYQKIIFATHNARYISNQ